MSQRNPYKIPVKDTKTIRVHKDLVKVIERYSKIAQRDCNNKFGKGKFTVPKNYGSKVIGGLLK